MVEVIFCEDGTYEVQDIDSHYRTQRLSGSYKGKSCEVYYCQKASWKKYLLKLISTNEIDKEIKELKKRKKKIEKLRARIEKELE